MSERGWSPGPCLAEPSCWLLLAASLLPACIIGKSGVPALLAACLLEEISAQPRNPLPCEFATAANPSPRRCQSHVAMALHRRLGLVAVRAVGAARARECSSHLQESLQQPPPHARLHPLLGPARAPCHHHARSARSVAISVIRMPDPEERHLFGRLLNQTPWRASPICPPTDQSAQRHWLAPCADNNDSSVCTSRCGFR